MGDVILLLVVGLSVWYWWDGIRAKEVARKAGREACSQAEVQFLDDTVEKKKAWLRRDERGHIQLCRLYFFEFTRAGERRYQGRVVLLGKRVGEVEMDAYRI
ncbi:MAG: hypothetical protein BMS9Abin22_255 [Gammaproteobacteria bacterium]|nr:MAG: hypothetical protein BMS9Abin22_255 [Gammaproteobacteria bacterium]